jgi:hypothetical protein
MRTTLTLDDQLASELKEIAHRAGRPFKEVVNETLRNGLRSRRGPAAKAYRLETVSLGGLRGGASIDKALRIADQLEDEELARKLELRK